MTWAEAYEALVDVHSFIQQQEREAKEAGEKLRETQMNWLASRLPITQVRAEAQRNQ